MQLSQIEFNDLLWDASKSAADTNMASASPEEWLEEEINQIAVSKYGHRRP